MLTLLAGVFIRVVCSDAGTFSICSSLLKSTMVLWSLGKLTYKYYTLIFLWETFILLLITFGTVMVATSYGETTGLSRILGVIFLAISLISSRTVLTGSKMILFLDLILGPSWGENGYIRIARNASNQCGIAGNGNYPLI